MQKQYASIVAVISPPLVPSLPFLPFLCIQTIGAPAPLISIQNSLLGKVVGAVATMNLGLAQGAVIIVVSIGQEATVLCSNE